MPTRTCRCGSGHDRYALTDAAGIFCCYVCESCEDAKRAKYNSAIFESGTAYSTSGEEQLIGIEDE